MNKPLGIKNYGSIPHLPNSRMGTGDHRCPDGQAKIATVKRRDKHDRIIVQEKLDGSNVGICKVNGIIYPLTRSGYVATTSPYKQHHMFADWVRKNWMRFDDLLFEGERVVGEWLLQAHGTRYELPHEHFVAFDILRGTTRLSYDEFSDRISNNFIKPRVIHTGDSFSVEEAVKAIEVSGHGAIDPVEGAVWRVERDDRVDFLVKYVRPDKVDGVYLPEVSGREPMWNKSLITG